MLILRALFLNRSKLTVHGEDKLYGLACDDLSRLGNRNYHGNFHIILFDKLTVFFCIRY